MNTAKNFATINLRLNQIDTLEVVILLATYLIKYVFQIKQKILNLSMFNIENINKAYIMQIQMQI